VNEAGQHNKGVSSVQCALIEAACVSTSVAPERLRLVRAVELLSRERVQGVRGSVSEKNKKMAQITVTIM
jgi:hypothetical protein